MLDRLLPFLAEKAGQELKVDILQPVDPFLETAGEEMRSRIFITADNDGEALCLRPEFTIPICLGHVQNAGNAPKRYAYGGTVFRQQRRGNAEFKQAGLEDLGRSDSIAADADCLADLFAAFAHLNLPAPDLALGDQNLFGVVVENLGLPSAIASRLVRAFGDKVLVEKLINDLGETSGTAAPQNRAEELAAKGDLTALTHFIVAEMQAANLSPKAGRKPQDIAQRLIDKRRESTFRLDEEHANLLRNFLALDAPLTEAVAALEQFAAESDLNFGKSLTHFAQRIEACAERDVPLDKIRYLASFGRNLDYYSGFLFDAHLNGENVAGGGRYDHLCTLLGGEISVPAVGFSITLDRLEGAA